MRVDEDIAVIANSGSSAPIWASAADAESLREGLEVFTKASAKLAGGSTAIKPGHRKKFHWPPHPVSYQFHVLASEWTGRSEILLHGERFALDIARTPHGVFGRSRELWLEARGDDMPEMLNQFELAAEPFFQRMHCIASVLGRPNRFLEHVSDLSPLDLLKLLYASDRDVANEARVEIEKRAGNRLFTQALIFVLNDDQHPYRRSAQWCVLDLFEDLISYVRDPQEERLAVDAIRNLIWNATDDYARTTYKAGVVLGGNLPGTFGAQILVECLDAPSKIGRRSAIHGLFHVVEWEPELQATIIAQLRSHAANEPEEVLANFARDIATDLEGGDGDHAPEPLFSEEE